MKLQTKTRSGFGMLLAIGLMVAFMGVSCLECYADGFNVSSSSSRAKFATYQKYAEGDGVRIDDRRAGRALQQAADAGYFDAQMELALLHVLDNDKMFEMFGIERDADKLDELLDNISDDILHAAEEGNTKAMMLLFLCYSEGKGFEKNDEELVLWLAKWINAWQKDTPTDYIEQQVMLGVYSGMKSNPAAAEALEIDVDALATKVFTIAKQLADKDNAMAMYALGMCYKDGIGTPKSSYSAKKWFQKSADRGCEDAKSELENL